MVNSVKGLGVVQKDAHQMGIIINGMCHFIYNHKQGMNSTVFLSESKLGIIENIM